VRSASVALKAHLGGSLITTVVDLVTVTLVTATVFRWTNHNQDITTGGNTWTSGWTGTAPIPTRSGIRDTLGMDPSELSLPLLCGSSAELGSGVQVTYATSTGVLDGATVRLERCYLDSSGAVIGTLLRFTGLVSTVNITSTSVTMTVRSDLERLNTLLPRHLHRPLCSHALGDAGCGVVMADHDYSGTVNGSPTVTIFTSSAAGAGTDYYTGGYLVFTSGVNNGQIRNIVAYNNGTTQFTVEYPLPAAPGVGDTFTAYAGCDKTISTCRTKFWNLPRRRGSDFMPTEDMVGG
jgi:uncharacterized phage protein (TIGR02218 family)